MALFKDTTVDKIRRYKEMKDDLDKQPFIQHSDKIAVLKILEEQIKRLEEILKGEKPNKKGD